MTKVFEELQAAINDPEIRNSEKLSKDNIENACMYQIATSMVHIEKSLERIENELKGIKGRV